jgi:GT2 family glycosyltransferase
MQRRVSVAVLLACYNRFETTRGNLEILYDALSTIEDVDADLYLLDDASPDNTGSRLRALHPELTVGTGSGSLYWNRGMVAAWHLAQKDKAHDVYLLFNDDVRADSEGVREAFDTYLTANEAGPAAVVGWTRGTNGDRSYGGLRRADRFRPLRFDHVRAGDAVVECDTFNGNFVLFPGPHFRALGGLDPVFVHQYGDLDLGLRAHGAGMKVLQTLDSVGECDRGPGISGKKPDTRLGSLVNLFGKPDGIRSYSRYVWRHGVRYLYPVYLGHRTIVALRSVVARSRDAEDR